MPTRAAHIPADEPPLRDSDYENLAEFRYALRKFTRFSEDAAAHEGLTPQQHQALLAIRGVRDGDSLTIGELAERLQIRHHSAVGLVDRLVSEELVARKMAEGDRRKVHVALTPRGQQAIEKLSQSHRQELRRIGPAFRELLDRISPE